MSRNLPLKTCLVCSASNLITGVRAMDYQRGSYVQQKLGKDRNPEALIFKNTEKTGVSAIVCGDCGYVHYFADDPTKLVLDPADP